MLNKACETCKASITEHQGRLIVKEAARAVTERDDRLLTEQLTALEAANRCAPELWTVLLHAAPVLLC